MTTERIDVLAVMDHWIESETAYGADCLDLIQARVAVECLVEALKAERKVRRKFNAALKRDALTPALRIAMGSASAITDAALARVRGAA